MNPDWIALLTILAGVLAVWVFGGPPAVFVIRIRDGSPVVTRGKVTEAFLRVIAEACRELAVSSGEVRGVQRGKRVTLRFSASLPSGFCQRLRNWWALSGW